MNVRIRLLRRERNGVFRGSGSVAPFKSRLERIRHKNKTSAQPMLYRGFVVRGTGLAPLDSRRRRHARHRITKRPCSVALSALSRRGGATILMDCCLFRPFKSRLERIRHKNKTPAQPMLYRGFVVQSAGICTNREGKKKQIGKPPRPAFLIARHRICRTCPS